MSRRLLFYLIELIENSCGISVSLLLRSLELLLLLSKLLLLTPIGPISNLVLEPLCISFLESLQYDIT